MYDGSVQAANTISSVESPTITTTPTTDACQDVTAVKDHQTYSMEIINPLSLADKQARCERMKRQLERRNKIEGFWSYTCHQSCETNGDAVIFHARLNGMSLTYVSPL